LKKRRPSKEAIERVAGFINVDLLKKVFALSIASFAMQKSIPGLLLFLDFEKAV